MKNLALFIAAIALTTLAACGTPAPLARVHPPSALEVPSLKEAHAGYFLVGNVISPRNLGRESFDILTRHFNIVTAENHMKPDHLQRVQGVFTFSAADSIVDAALEAGMYVHGHTLAWHQQSPDWKNHEGISREQAIENLQTHIRTVMGHFRGRVRSWDVVNEVMSNNPSNPEDWVGSLRPTPWLRAIGPEYIEIAFRTARETDPTVLLYYNDYNMDNQRKARAVYHMIRDINERNPDVMGRPLIDGMGMQGHYSLGTVVENVRGSIRRFASLGVQVSITELDILAGENYRLTEGQAMQQGIMYARLFALFREHAHVIDRVTIWGIDDEHSWRARQNPVLFDAWYRAKPAFFAALEPVEFLAQHNIFFREIEPLVADARRGTPAMNPDDPLWQTAPAISVSQYTLAWPGPVGTARVLWDDRYLHVMVDVTNSNMNMANPIPQEQDSVEIFIDEGNLRAGTFGSGDGQFRVNFANDRSFNPPGIATGFESLAFTTGERSYTVIARIPFRTIVPANGTTIGFDVHINGASPQGFRQSIAVWNDTSGNSWQDTSGFGSLRLVP